MDAVVYIGHGSRRECGNAQFIKFVHSVMREVPFKKQEIAFLEVTKPTISETMEKLISEGAKQILVVPVLLFAAAHLKLDIPAELQAIQNKHPHVSFVVTDPFGTHPNMVELVVKKARATVQEPSTAILLVGRGSSDPEPVAKLQEISDAVEKRLNIPVYEAYLTSSLLTVDAVLTNLQQSYEKVYVVPYLLFTGILLEKIKHIVSGFGEHIILRDNLQYDELMKRTLIQRIEEKCMPWALSIQ